MRLYKGIGSNFYRKKRMDLVYKELKYFKDVEKVQYNYFWADTFLGMSNKEFDEFCEMYSDIKLPFWIQTRPETVTDHNMKKLNELRPTKRLSKTRKVYRMQREVKMDCLLQIHGLMTEIAGLGESGGRQRRKTLQELRQRVH